MTTRLSNEGVIYYTTPENPVTWTTIPNPLTTSTAVDTYTYATSTITGAYQTMPTPTYTSAQINAVETQYNRARDSQKPLLTEFLRYKLEHVRRPELWTRSEYLSIAKGQLKRNMERNIRSYRIYIGGSEKRHYESLMNQRRHFYEIGKMIADCFRTQDDSELVSILNDNTTIRDKLGAGEWCEILNDVDKFPNAPDYNYCSDCDYIECEDDGTWVYNGDRWICSDCRDNNYRWSDYHDCVVHEDDDEPDQDDDDEDEEDVGPIGSYHSSKSKLGFIPTKYSLRKTPVYMGLELEMEMSDGDASRRERAEHLLQSVKEYKDDATGKHYTYALLEQDGSLNHGFEMVTGYTGLDVHAKQLSFFKKPFEGMKSHDTKTCGLHVHICKKGMSMFHAAKLILFMHDSRNQRLFKAIARRDSSRYSQVKNKTSDYSWVKHAKSDGMRRLNEDRYESVNFQPERTVEFRLFKGTLRYETIMACLEFTYASWFFTRDTGQQDLTSENFIKFICQPDQRKDTIYLRSFLRSKGFMLDKQAVVKPNPRIEQTKQLHTTEA